MEYLGVLSVCLLVVMVTVSGVSRPVLDKPNIILIVGDDMGYGDLQVYGHPTQEPGALDKMAAEGIRFTQFYAPAVLCTPSRAALMTARLAQRIGMIGGIHILLSNTPYGLPHWEITIPEVLKTAGYTTGIVGKWHLGTNAHNSSDGSYLPHTQGFDYVGHILPHSLVWDCDTSKVHRKQVYTQKCYLYRNTTLVQQPIKLETLTDTLLVDAKSFVYNNTDKAFFLYMSMPQTHTPMFNHPRFKGKSKRGAYGDQINEMNWAIGEMVELLERENLTKNTLVLFVSDHGPHKEMCAEGGTTGELRGGKLNFFEGGIRVPAIAWWPGTIPGGQVATAVAGLMDVMPTFAQLAGVAMPQDRVIDGRSFADILLDTDKHLHRDIHDALYFYEEDILVAMRYKQYKIHFQSLRETDYANIWKKNCDGYKPRKDVYLNDYWPGYVVNDPVVIYDLHVDPAEQFPLDAAEHSDLVEKVKALAEIHERNMGITSFRPLAFEHFTSRVTPCCNPPYCVCGLR